MPIPVGDLVQNQAIISVELSTTLTEALNIMIEHDFSQLPILDSKSKPVGMVTTTSISRALLRFGAKVEDLRVSDATVRIPEYPADEDLLYILDNILQHSVVFITDSSKALIGILTEYDTTQYFRQRAEDIVLVENIESALKDHLRYAYESIVRESEELREAINSLSNSWDGIRKKTDSCLRAYSKAKEIPAIKAEIDLQVNKYFPKNSENKSLDSLTLSEFVQLAQKNWQKFEPIFNLSSATWSKMLDEVREVRNKLVHFRGAVSSVERHSLRFCSDWLKAHPVPQPEVVVTEDSIKSTTDRPEILQNLEFEPGNTTLNKEAVDRAIKVKYADFAIYLKSLNPNSDSANIFFSQIEEMVKGNLPQAARKQDAWWMDVSAHTVQWLETGWRVGRPILGAASPLICFTNWAIVPHAIVEPWQFIFWCGKLKCSEQELKEAIKAVGSDSDLVEIHIEEEHQKSVQ